MAGGIIRKKVGKKARMRVMEPQCLLPGDLQNEADNGKEEKEEKKE